MATIAPLPGFCADQATVLTTARTQIQRGDFKSAAELLRIALYKDGQSPITWLLLGQCYERQNDNNTAMRTYKMLIQYFPTSTEAASARVFLSLLERQRPATVVNAPTVSAHMPSGTIQTHGQTQARGQTTASAPAVAQTSVPPPAFSASLALKDRIAIIQPRFNHKPVASSTVALVRSVVAQLPPTIYQILHEGGTKIFVVQKL